MKDDRQHYYRLMRRAARHNRLALAYFYARKAMTSRKAWELVTKEANRD